MRPRPTGFPNCVPPAVYFPYPKMGQSASGIACDTTGGKFGPFEGPDVRRRPVVQLRDAGRPGAGRRPATRELACPSGPGSPRACCRCCSAPMARCSWAGPTWGGVRAVGGGFALERMAWTGKVPFEIQEVHARPEWVRAELHRGRRPKQRPPIPRLLSSDDPHLHLPVELRQPRGRRDRAQVEKADRRPDGLSVRLVVGPLQRGHVHTLTLGRGPVGARANALLHAEAYYTLNDIPKE